jgi:DNA-binding Lrp family transcriptional regulator
MRILDPHEEKIVKALVRNPRWSDTRVSRATGVPVRTVNRKRKRLEREGLLAYYTNIDLSPTGAAQFAARHLYLIQFRPGIPQSQIVNEIKTEPNIRTVFTELIYESHLAEVEGHATIVMLVEGESDEDINNKFNGQIVPSLLKNHGDDSIVRVSSIILGRPIRLFHNYVPMVNMDKGRVRDDWSDEAIFVGKTKGK